MCVCCRQGKGSTARDARDLGVPDDKQQTPRAAPEEVRTAGAAGSPRWATRLVDRARWLGAAVVAWRWLQHDRGRATLRPCAPKYALRGSASVANSSAVWAQPPRGASAPAFSPVPPGSRSAHFLCVVGRLEVCLEGTTAARRQPDGAEQLALGPRVGNGAAGGLRTPASRVRSTLLPRPSCSPLHGVCAASEVHGVCLCTADSEQGFVYAYVGLARMQLLCARASLGV